MGKLKNRVAALFASIWLAAAPSVGHAGTYMGAGAETCGTWVQSAGKTERYVLRQWVFGFVSYPSVTSSGRADILETVDAASIDVWMDNYCRSRPLDTIERAALSLLVDLTRAATPAGR